MTQVRYSRLNDGSPANNAKRSIFQTTKICGVISCLLIVGCVLVAIVIAKLLAENKFLESPYTNYTSSYSFGVVSDLQLDLTGEQCCPYPTNYSCLCCPNNPQLMAATFQSLNAVLKMYVNTKFILYLGNIASVRGKTIETYTYVSDYLRGASINIPVYPTLGIHDRPKPGQHLQLFYAELYASWINLIDCFDCPLASSGDEVKPSIISGGYYSIATTYGIRIISINTNLFLRNGTSEDRADAEEQLEWLDDVLLKSTGLFFKGKILIGGCAPGYSTEDVLIRKPGPDNHVEGEWDPVFQRKFNDLIITHQFRWSAIFMGGVEYELVRKLDKHYVFLTPPTSPLHCSQPVFRVAFLSERDLELLDLHQYYSPIEFFTRVGEAPKYMFDYSYERVIFGSEQPRGPVYLNYYSITRFYRSIAKEFNLQHWKTLSYTKKINKNGTRNSPLVTYCITQHSNQTNQLDCLRDYKYDL